MCPSSRILFDSIDRVSLYFGQAFNWRTSDMLMEMVCRNTAMQ